ncbi:MAG: SNF2-related protein, partial [Rhodanobacter sp.]
MDTLQLQYMLGAAPWNEGFDEAAMQRGTRYFRSGRVIALHHQQKTGMDVLLGVVRGSALEPYRCTIRLSLYEGALRLASDCTCPLVAGCKHVVAVLLATQLLALGEWPGAHGDGARHAGKAMGSPQGAEPTLAVPFNPDPLPQWTQWLRALDQAQAGTRQFVAETGRQFGILLRGESGSTPPQLLVNLAWMRPTRGSRNAAAMAHLVDPQPLQLAAPHGPVPAPAEGWSAAVTAALAVLLQGPRVHAAGRGDWIPVQAEYQEQALDTLLAIYPVFHERGSVPLARGPVLALQTRWKDAIDGSQSLIAEVQADAATLLLRGARLWYVQPREHRFGQTDGDAGWLDALARVPTVRPEQVAMLRARLGESPRTAALPMPVERGPLLKLDCDPSPVLLLRVVRARGARGGASVAIGCARLAWDYGPVRITRDISSTIVHRLHDGQVYAVHRRRPAELAFATPLRQAGLLEAGWQAQNLGIDARQLDYGDLLLQPLRHKPPLPASEWQDVIDQLQHAGFAIEYSADFPRERIVEIEQWHADVQAHGSQWFDVSLGIDVGGARVDLLPLLRRMLNDPDFPLRPPVDESDDATWPVALDSMRSVRIPLARLRALIEPLLEWLQGEGEQLRVHRTRADALTAMGSAAQLPWHGGDLLRAQAQRLQQAARSAPTPPGFNATLRPYQSEGLAWLDFLADAGLGGILADDMGLGKTVQVLAHIVGEKQRGRLEHPALVVAPTSLVGNWRDETTRFAPMLKVLVLHGANRAELYARIADHDLVITTYPLLPRDEARLRESRFSLLVLDEAQAIKNAHSQAAKVVRTIPATRRLAMTGTPLENHLGELWAQFDAVEPGLLGSERQFNKLYRTPIEKHADRDRQQRLNQRIGALLLRRRKQDVLTDLPAKTEIVLPLELAGAQRSLYETLRLAQHERVQQAVKERGLAQAGIIVL